VNRDPIGEKGGLNQYGFVVNQTIQRIDILGKCSLTIISVPSEGSFPPGVPENRIAWYEATSVPVFSWVPNFCESPESGERGYVSPCAATIWKGGSGDFAPPEHEMEHYNCLSSLENSLIAAKVDLGCVCEKDACYQARKGVVGAQVNVAVKAYDVCILSTDCADNGEGQASHPSCQQLIVAQLQLQNRQNSLQVALQARNQACQ